MESFRFITSAVLAVCLFAGVAVSNALEEPTKEQRIAEFAKLPVAERQKPEFFVLKLVVMDSVERVAAQPDRSKIKLAENEEILVFKQTKDGKPSTELLIVEKRPRINRTHIADSYAHFDVNGWELSIKFTELGGRLFGDMTTEAMGQRLAMVVGGSFVLSAPNINEPILNGSATISAGDFTEKDVTLLTSLFAEPKLAEPK